MSAYRKTIGKVGVVLAFALAFALTTTTRAEAAFVAYICNDALCDGAGDVIVTDGGAGDAAPGVPGAIAIVGINVGGFLVTTNTSVSKPVRSEPSMDLAFSASTLTSGHIWLYASDSGFTTISPLAGTIDGNSDSSGSIIGSIYGGCNNSNLPTGLCNPVSTAPQVLPGAFSAQLVHPPASLSPYSMTLGVEIIANSPGTTSGDFLVVPEPASIVLLGMGLIGAGAASRRRKSKV